MSEYDDDMKAAQEKREREAAEEAQRQRTLDDLRGLWTPPEPKGTADDP